MLTPLVIFDIDGTLCDTFGVDEECFRRACGEVLGIDGAALDWESAPHITDAGICDWFWSRYCDRPPTREELTRVSELYVALLQMELDRDRTRFRPTAGASDLLKLLIHREWNVAVATGGWSAPARLKLMAAGLRPELLLASSDDAFDRVEVFRQAKGRAAARASKPVGRTVLVGDGLWDIRVASACGWCFVGIADGARAERLRGAGAAIVVTDFSDVAGVLRALETATMPRFIEARAL